MTMFPLPRDLRVGALGALLLVGAVGGCAFGGGGPGADGSIDGVSAGSSLYVANQGAAAVTVIDVASMRVTDVIDLEALGFGANASPHHVAVEPDGSAWYVSLIGAGRVLKFDRRNQLVGSAEIEVPGLLAIHPTEDWLFVGRSMAAVNPPSRIGRIDRSTMDVEEIEVFVPRPHGIVVSPDGLRVYVASLAENTLAVVNAETDEAELIRVEPRDEPVGFVQLAISPDGEVLVATGQISASLLAFRLDGGADAPELIGQVAVGREPWHPTFTPDGSEVWLGNLATDEITVVETSGWSVSDVITAPAVSEPHGSAVTPDGSRVFIANRNTGGRYAGSGTAPFGDPAGTVVVLDTDTREVIGVIDTPPYAAGIGIAAGTP